MFFQFFLLNFSYLMHKILSHCFWRFKLFVLYFTFRMSKAEWIMIKFDKGLPLPCPPLRLSLRCFILIQPHLNLHFFIIIKKRFMNLFVRFKIRKIVQFYSLHNPRWTLIDTTGWQISGCTSIPRNLWKLMPIHSIPPQHLNCNF